MHRLAFILIVLSTAPCLGKLKIDVSVRLAENICVLVDYFKAYKVPKGNLTEPHIEIFPQTECFLWRWTRCDHNAPMPCSTWNKVPCGPNRTDEKKPHCEEFQCGWTLDELNQNWGFNPEHIHPQVPIREPHDPIIDTGSTLDFLFLKDNELGTMRK